MSYEYVPDKTMKKQSILGRIFKKKNKQKVNSEQDRLSGKVSSVGEKISQKEKKNDIPYNKMVIDSMDGYTFEKYCTAILMQAGFTNVRHTKLSGDFGVDILAEYDGKRIAIQCKRYSKPVGVKAVQEVLGGAQYYECEKTMIISNQILTTQAMEMARKTNTLFISIEKLVKIANDTILGEKKINNIDLSDEQLRSLAMCIYKVYENLYIDIKITNISVNCNEVIYAIKKKDNVRLNKITSEKNEVSYNLGIEFEIRVDYENQNILFCFTRQDIEKWIKRQEEINNPKHNNDKKFENIGTRDPLFENAAYLIIEKEKVSVGMLMRVLKIGYDRSTKIIEQLEEAGIISEKQENGFQNVLMNMEEYEIYKMKHWL